MSITSGGRYYLLILLVVIFACRNQNVLALTASIGPDGCNAQAVHDLGFKGQGVLVGVFSQKHVLVTHEAFYAKDQQGYPAGASYASWFDATGDSVYEPDISDPQMPGHDTSMCGIVGSRGGRLYQAEIGVAPGCEILSVRITRPVSDTDPTRQIYVAWLKRGLDELLSQGGRVVVTGIQLVTDIDQFSLVYDYYAYNNDMLFINAAGNDYSTMTVFGDGFNGITTGGLIMPEMGIYRQVGTASNPGPTADGRRKPEIAAPAQNLQLPTSSLTTAWINRGTTRGETSWAGPHAAGVAALLVQYAKTTTAESDDNKSAVIKAVMVNSTFPNIKTKTGQITTGQTWNAQRGYGRVDALRAYQLLKRPKVANNTTLTQTAGWSYQYVSQSNQVDTYWINGNKNQRLVLTVTWHRAVRRVGPSSSSVYEDETTPKFNLNLNIYDPQNNLLFSDADTLNNLRKADIVLPGQGYYKVQLNSNQFATGRYYAMAYELLDPLKADFNVDSIVDTSDLIALADSWLADNCANSGQPCYWLDLFADGQIDFQDMAILSADWLTIDPRYYPVP
jgi:hypothetical protein